MQSSSKLILLGVLLVISAGIIFLSTADMQWASTEVKGEDFRLMRRQSEKGEGGKQSKEVEKLRKRNFKTIGKLNYSNLKSPDSRAKEDERVKKLKEVERIYQEYMKTSGEMNYRRADDAITELIRVVYGKRDKIDSTVFYRLVSVRKNIDQRKANLNPVVGAKKPTVARGVNTPAAGKKPSKLKINTGGGKKI